MSDIRIALQKLVARLDEVHRHPAYGSVWAVHQMHCGPYEGPTYTHELELARAVLKVDAEDTTTRTEP